MIVTLKKLPQSVAENPPDIYFFKDERHHAIETLREAKLQQKEIHHSWHAESFFTSEGHLYTRDEMLWGWRQHT